MARATVKQLYGYKGYPHAKFVKFGQHAHQIYKFFASKRNAENGLARLRRSFGKSAAPARVVKTTRGWAVVQLARAGYRIKSTDKNLYKIQ